MYFVVIYFRETEMKIYQHFETYIRKCSSLRNVFKAKWIDYYQPPNTTHKQLMNYSINNLSTPVNRL